MENKRILLLGGNFYPEPTGIGKYNGEMIDWLATHGFDCTVVTTYPYYPQWKLQKPWSRRRFWYTSEVRVTDGDAYVRVHRCPHYVPSKPNGKKRMLLDLSFTISAFFKVLQLLAMRKYDVVITVAPPFHLGLLAVLYKRVRGAKFLYHVQDLQIEAARDLNLIKQPWILKALFRTERFIFKEADQISTISEGMIRHIEEKSGKEVQFFPNWSNISFFYPLTDKAGIKRIYGFLPTDKIILYSGAIGEKQGLDTILEAADRLSGQKDIRFVICGSGPYKEQLEETAKGKGLQNVAFLPLQPLQTFNRFLNMADVHLIIQKSGAADLVMPSKLTNILAVGGLSIVTADPGTCLYDVVAGNEIGLLIPPEDPEALAGAIQQALGQDHSEIHRNSRSYAENYLSIDGILTRYFESV